MANWRSTETASSSFSAETLDIEDLRARAGDDESLVVELLESFLERGVVSNEIHAAAEARAYEEVVNLVHRLRGSLLALGATSSAHVAGEVEAYASTIVTGEAGPDACSTLAAALADLDVRLNQAVQAMRTVVERHVADALRVSGVTRSTPPR